MSVPFIAECLDCGNRSLYQWSAPHCPNCHSTWREARYPQPDLAGRMLADLPHRPFRLWRYQELLPVAPPEPGISFGDGGTPLLRAVNLGLMLGCSNIFIKDERQGPTQSFKDRQAALSIAAYKEAGIKEIVLASTGNVAIAYSAYAARAGIKVWAFLTSQVPAEKMREIAFYGTQVVKITGSYDQAKQLAADFARQRHITLDLGSRSIACIESMKTIAFEAAEQISTLLCTESDPSISPTPWRAPDWYFQSVSGGLGPLGVLKGFTEMAALGLTGQIPKMGLIQAEGCAPMVHAWKQNRDVATPVQVSTTAISTLATGDPGRTYTLLREKILAASGGIFESVSDEETFRAMHFLAKMEGISVEPAAAVSVAGLIKLIRAGVVRHDELILINCSGHTMPIESHILGELRAKGLNLTDQVVSEHTEEGLLAALQNIKIDRFPRVAIVDDNADARRLIRRILQSQGNFIISEADNGREALEVAVQQAPDLIVLDLMMPEMDGFAVLDRLQENPVTAQIPVIVVTAKELTATENALLNGRIQSLKRKGDFFNEELLDEIRSLIG